MEHTKATQRQYQLDHKEELAAKKKIYNLANKEKIAAANKAYRLANPEHVAALHKEYEINNREKLNAKSRERNKKYRLFFEVLKEFRSKYVPWNETEVKGKTRLGLSRNK